MRLLYFSNERIPGTSACAIQQMQMCDAFARAGADVTLIRPFYFELTKYGESAIREFYDVGHIFRIKTLPTLLSISKPIKGGRTGQRINLPYIGGGSMLFSTWFYTMAQLFKGRMKSRTIIYSRNVNATTVLLYLKDRWMHNKPVQIFFEVHSIDQARPKKFFRQILKKTDGLISITEALKTDLVTQFRVDPDAVFVSPDGVKNSRLEKDSLDRRDARMVVNIPHRFKKVVLYTGQIIPGKGVEVFIEAAAEFEDDILFLVVGGMPESVERMRTSLETDRLKNVNFTGFIEPRSIPAYQAAADVLVLPNTEGDAISSYTSPLKLFEYMAAQRPIVASDLPPLHEILRHESNVLFAPPGDARALSLAIRRLLNDRVLADRISTQAFHDVSSYTWEERARKILRFIDEKCGMAG